MAARGLEHALTQLALAADTGRDDNDGSASELTDLLDKSGHGLCRGGDDAEIGNFRKVGHARKAGPSRQVPVFGVDGKYRSAVAA
ncbi:hypothetical protein D3C87_1823900 [compost metagenome]